MTELRVIQGIPLEKPDYRGLYADALLRILNSLSDEGKAFGEADLDTRKKLILLGVKLVNQADYASYRDYKMLQSAYSLIHVINSVMSTLTPGEFQTVFPIAKEYDGAKYQLKDYFYTKKYIEEFGMNKVIGEKIQDFHWEYHNWELTRFLSATMRVMSAIRRAEGGKGFAEEYFEKEGLPTYTMTEDSKGKQFMTNNQIGETQQVKKKRPRYLKVIK